MEGILTQVHASIDARNMIKSIINDVIEEAITHSNTTVPELRLIRQERMHEITQPGAAAKASALKAAAAARFDLLVLSYRRDPKLVVTNPVNGQEYTTSLKREDLSKLREVGYETRSIILGTTKHLYGAVRAVMIGIKRSTSLRIWYLNDNKECTVVLSNDWTPVTRIIDRKLFVTTLWGTVDKRTLDDDDDSEAD